MLLYLGKGAVRIGEKALGVVVQAGQGADVADGVDGDAVDEEQERNAGEGGQAVVRILLRDHIVVLLRGQLGRRELWSIRHGSSPER